MRSSGTEGRFVVRADLVASRSGVGCIFFPLLSFPARRVGSVKPTGFTYRTACERAQRF